MSQPIRTLVAVDEGGNGDAVMLGHRAVVRGAWERQSPPDPDGTGRSWGVEAAVVGDVPVRAAITRIGRFVPVTSRRMASMF